MRYPWMDFHGDEPPWVDTDTEWCGQCDDPEVCPACGLAQRAVQEYGPAQARPERSPGGFHMTVIAPERSYAQRINALSLANTVRSRRAELKRDMKAGRERFPDVLYTTDPLLATMRVYDLLVSIPKVRRVKAQMVLSRARVSGSKTLGGLTERQRRELLICLAALPSVAASVRPAGTIQP